MRLRPPSLALLGAGLLSSIRPVLSAASSTSGFNSSIAVRAEGQPFTQNQLFKSQTKSSLVFDFSLNCNRSCSMNSAALFAHEPADPEFDKNTSFNTSFYPRSRESTSWLELNQNLPPLQSVSFDVIGTITLHNTDIFARDHNVGQDLPHLSKFRLRVIWNTGKISQSLQIQNDKDFQNSEVSWWESPYFSVADINLSPQITIADQEKFAAQSQTPSFTNFQPGSNGGGGISGSGPITTADNPPQASNTGSPGNTDQTFGSGARGLSTGEIVGIAVGAALGTLLLGTIVAWFCLRRRRQSKAGKPGLAYSSGPGRSGDIVAEKEANTMVAESPRSPYSEDGHHRESTLIGSGSAASSGAAGLMAAHRNERDRDAAGDYVPYSDLPTSSSPIVAHTVSSPVARAGSSNSRSTVDRSSAAFPASAVPPPAIGEEGIPPRADTGMSGRYAHLVEDGMTREEIARLEEEEHQLDVAIEQARGVTTK